MTIPATKAMMLLLSHCSLVILRSARMDFDKGEKEYHAENEQPVDKRVITTLGWVRLRLPALLLTERRPGEEEHSTMPIKWVDNGQLLSLAVQRVDGRCP
jgi:hypothetical protein